MRQGTLTSGSSSPAAPSPNGVRSRGFVSPAASRSKNGAASAKYASSARRSSSVTPSSHVPDSTERQGPTTGQPGKSPFFAASHFDAASMSAAPLVSGGGS